MFEFGDTRPHKVGNPALRRAIADLAEDPSSARRDRLYESLYRGPLLIAVRELPQDLKEGYQILTEDVEIEFLTSEGPDGGQVILAFTDIEALNARVEGADFIALDPTTVLQWVLDEGYSGLVINPDGPWAGIPREDIEDIIKKQPKVKPTQAIPSIPFRSTTPFESIREALSRLLNRPGKGSEITLQDESSGKTLRFYGSTTQPLGMVIALDEFEDPDKEKLMIILEGMGADYSKEKEIEELNFEDDYEKAALAAMDIFTRGLNVGPQFTVLIQENSPQSTPK